MKTYIVTSSHIDDGVKNSIRHGPISNCLKEQNGEYLDRNAVHTFSESIYSLIFLNEYAQKNHIYEYTLSDGLKDWMNKFDQSEPVNPINICVDKDHCYIEGEYDDKI